VDGVFFHKPKERESYKVRERRPVTNGKKVGPCRHNGWDKWFQQAFPNKERRGDVTRDAGSRKDKQKQKTKEGEAIGGALSIFQKNKDALTDEVHNARKDPHGWTNT